MKKTLQIWGVLFSVLFLFPIVVNLLPNSEGTKTAKIMKESRNIVYASNIFQEDMKISDQKILLYFTHNHEAYEPVTKAKSGKVAASHQVENITKFGEKLQAQLTASGIETDILPVDNAEELKKQRKTFSKSYHSIRPFVEQQVAEKDYQLIIDLHRDSIGRDKTTLDYEGKKYARVAFVVGLEHPNYKQNEEKVIRLKEEMEKKVPGITRNIIRKSGRGVDGRYNQDLHPAIILVELGGPQNTEEELNETIIVLAESIEAMFAN